MLLQYPLPPPVEIISHQNMRRRKNVKTFKNMYKNAKHSIFQVHWCSQQSIMNETKWSQNSYQAEHLLQVEIRCST